MAVFVDGCFWRACPIHGTWRKAHAEFWLRKIKGNRLRDRETDQRLTSAGWMVIRIWEHEDATSAVETVPTHIAQRRLRIGRQGRDAAPAGGLKRRGPSDGLETCPAVAPFASSDAVHKGFHCALQQFAAGILFFETKRDQRSALGLRVGEVDASTSGRLR